MKKGSRARHCANCRKIVFWVVPVKNCGLFIEAEHKEVLPYKYSWDNATKTGGYYCIECYRKIAEKTEGR